MSRLETFWIYELQSHSPLGLNIEWDINAFINKYETFIMSRMHFPIFVYIVHIFFTHPFDFMFSTLSYYVYMNIIVTHF